MTASIGRAFSAVALGLALLAPTVARAQVAAGGSLDVASSYVWRGMELTEGPVLQPGLWIGVGSLELGTWGSYATGGGFREQDFWLTYYLPELPVGSLTLTLNDYYATADGESFLEFGGVEHCPADEGVGDPPRCATGTHTLELMSTFSAAALPVELLVGYNLHNDPARALYVEASYSPALAGFDLGLGAGGVLGESEWYYGNESTALVNLRASVGRSLTVGAISLPVGVELVHNPLYEETYYLLRVGIAADR